MKTLKVVNYKLKTKRHNLKAKSSLVHLSTFFIFYLLVFSLKAQTPNSTENYIMSTEYLDSIGDRGQKKVGIMYFDGLGREKQAISYKATPGGKDVVVHYDYDEFGRQSLDYLPAPTTQASGQIIADPLTTFYDSYYDDEYAGEDGIYFSQKKLEESVLGRPLKQSAPGKEWEMNGGHEIGFDYSFNAEADAVRIFKADAQWSSTDKIYNISLTDIGKPHSKNRLYRVRTTDENGNTTTQFTNKFGQMILQRKYVTPDTSAGRPGNPPAQAVKADTYYVYDQYGNLTYVIPPLAAEKTSVTQTILDELCYQYKYDKRNRLVERKLPGKGWEYLVYDRQDRLVATQDAEMAKTTFVFPSGMTGKAWAFTKYDAYGRAVYTGLYKSTSTRKALQDLVDGYGQNNETRQSSSFSQNGVAVYYTKTGAFPKNLSASDSDLLTVNYYDTSYSNLLANGVSVPSQIGPYKVRQGNTTSRNQSLKGLPIASYVRVVPGSGWEKNYTFYDRRSRPVASHKVNHLGGYTKTETIPDFRGKPKSSVIYHARTDTATEIKVEDTFTYDAQERPLDMTRKTDNAANAERIFSNTYNPLGQLAEKRVGDLTSNAPLQKVDYSYNIRGWLTDINNIQTLTESGYKTDLFAFRINYNHDVQGYFDGSGIEPLYNGNIAETFWKTASDDVLRGYGYRYDQLNRMREAVYQKPGFTVPLPGNYDEYAAYDLNGNILSLHRYSSVADLPANTVFTDELQYAYATDSNKLMRVTDNTNSPTGFEDGTNNDDDYAYDANANMTKDKNKGITSIKYNHLNLPVEIYWSSTKKINYLYNAAGQKVKKTVVNGSTTTETDYLDGFQYRSTILEFFPHPEGYVKATATSIGTNPTYDFNYVYNYTDHLGNVRVSYAKDPQTGNLKILDESHYYPYGLKHQSYSSSGFIRNPYGDVIIAPVTNNPYKYKYNGKELQDELGLNMYDMDMRMYDPAIARWVVMDPVIHHTMSPYNAFDLNPVFWADPSGAEGESNNSSSDTESGGGSTPGAIGTDRYGNQTVNIGYGVNISAGTAAISVNNYGSSTGGKRNNTSARAKGNSSNSASNNSDFDWSSVTFEGDDPTITLEEVVINDMSQLEGALEMRANEALAIWSNYGHSGNSFSSFWNSTFTRLIIKDTYSVGLSSNVCAFLGTGTTPINFTLITRGKAPGIYFTPTVNGAVGSEVSANAGVAFSSGNYTGNPAQIEPSMLKGTSYGGSAEIGDVVSVSAGASYAPVNQNKPFQEGGFINSNVQIGVGFGAGIQGNIQNTTKVTPLIQF